MKPPSGPKKQTQSKPVLPALRSFSEGGSAVEWANFKKDECKLLCCRYYENKSTFAANNPKVDITTALSCGARIVAPEG